MDFSPTESQKDIRALAGKLMAATVTPASLKALEASGEVFHAKLWSELASAGLLGAALPEELGGSGGGFLELCSLFEAQGAAVAPVPLWTTLTTAFAIAEHGSPAQKKRWLPGVVSGEVILSAAYAEPGASDARQPIAIARGERGGFKVSGTKLVVPAAAVAKRILVPAVADGAVVVLLVDPRASGVTLEKQIITTEETVFTVKLSDVWVEADDVLADASRGRAVLDWTIDRATVALAATELGVASRALQMTAEYTAQRQQFDRPIATFQAVSQRAADAYVDVETLKLATQHAAWRLSEGLPATREVDIAKYWAAEAGHRVVYAAQHLHGGMGYDRDYPLHRYYMWSRQIELTLGGATQHLARLGAQLAASEEA
jgi:alkylation response protein AidB-like acyl-CoA dehydrogenase